MLTFWLVTPGQHPMHVGQVQQVAGFGFGCWGASGCGWCGWFLSFFVVVLVGQQLFSLYQAVTVQKGVNKRDASRHKSEDTFGTTHILPYMKSLYRKNSENYAYNQTSLKDPGGTLKKHKKSTESCFGNRGSASFQL